MTNEERREAVARLFKNAPDVLTLREVAKWTRYGKNTVYDMLKDGILPGYVFRGGYLVGKEDLIDFMVEYTDDIAHRYTDEDDSGLARTLGYVDYGEYL